MNVYLRRFLFFVLGLLGLVLLLVVGLVVFLQLPAGQDFVARRAEGYLRGKLKTEVRLGKFRTDFRHAINFDDVYLADQQRDTLLSVGHLGVSIAIWDLLHQQINVSDVELENGRVRLTRTEPDSVNNYDFIINAFSDPNAPKDTTQSALKYNIGKVHVANLLFTQNDQVSGSDLRAKVGDLLVTMDEVDVNNSVYKVNEATLKHSAVQMRQSKTAPELDDNKPTEPLSLTFGLNRAALEDVALVYQNDPSAQYINTRIGLAEVTAKNIDLAKEKIDLNKLTLKNTTFAYAQNKNVPAEQRAVNPAKTVRKVDEAAQKATAQPLSWAVTLGQSDISGLAVNFDNFNDPKVKSRYPALDYSHLHFTDLVLNTRDLNYTESLTTVKIDNLAGKDHSGFAVSRARANALYSNTDIKLDSLDLVTPNSRIKRSMALHFKSLGGIADDLPNLGLAGDLRNTRLGFRDILYLVPSLADTPPFNSGPNQSMLVSGLVTGRLGDLLVRNLDFVGLRNTVVQARRAHIVGLPNVDNRLFVDLDIQRLSTTRADLLSILPKGTVPSNINLPPSLTMSGTLKGRPTTLAFSTDLKLRSTYGNVAFAGQLGAPNRAGQQPVVGTFAVQNFEAGKLLNDPTLGAITATGRINATGNLSDPNTLVGKATATVQSARYNGYTYRGVQATVDLDRNKYTIAASSKDDPNLNLDLHAVVNLRDPRNPSYQVTSLNLRSVNLTKLGFYTGGDLRIQGDVTANLSGSDLNTINGTFGGRKLVIIKDNQPIALDSIQGSIVQNTTRTAVTFSSNVADVNLDGNVHLGDLATEVQRHISRYFRLPGVQPFTNTAGNQHFTYALRVKRTALVKRFVAGLKELSPFVLAGEYDRAAARLTADARIPVIRYQNYRLDSLRFNVGSDAQRLNYDLHLADAKQDTSLHLRRPSLTGSVADNQVKVRASILGDSSNRERLGLAGTLKVVDQGKLGDGYQFAFDNDQILNYDTWTAGTDNYVRYNADGTIVANNLRLTNGTSALVVQSQDPRVNTSPLAVRFEQFDLGIVSRAIGQPDSTLGGTLNGEAVARGLGTNRLGFTSNLTIKDLLYSKTVLGDVAVQASNPVADRYDVNATLTGGGGNDVNIHGNYRTTGTAPLDFVVDVRRLTLKTAEPFSAGQLSQTTGNLAGQLTLRGSPSAPELRGQLTTSADAGFVVPQLGSPFRLPKQTIGFDEKGIAFNNFTVLDSVGNKAVATGYLLTPNLVDYTFDLRVTTNKFLAVKSVRSAKNTMYYGRLVVDSDTHLTGPLSLININTTATVAKGSDLTVENPAADPSVVERQGIVQFVDFSLPAALRAQQAKTDSVTNAGVIGYDITAKITINDNTPFTIVVDPASGDNLRVRAAGTLTTHIDPAGQITLDGRLDVRRGKYQLSLYGLASREFIIRNGSYLLWSGDPYNAEVNITALYKVKAAPAELLAAQGANVGDPEARNTMDFNVLISATGPLSKPIIGFDITMPENQRANSFGSQVDAQLARLRQPDQVSELNKQVFSLLVLGRFIQQNPFETAAGEGILASQLRGSVSQVLTDQLHNLTGKYLAGLGLDLGVTNQADYTNNSAMGRTDLNVAVRRQLFNNRLTVRLGTDVPLSGNQGGTNATGGSSSASSFAGDVSLEYSILMDGRLRLRAYRQNAYEDIDGPIVRTGAALVFQRDYDNLADLFAKITPEEKTRLKEARRTTKQEKAEQKRRNQQLADSAAAANGARAALPDSTKK